MSYLEKWGLMLKRTDHIFTWTEPETLAYLADVASSAKLMIESGTYMGGSAAVMLEANSILHLWCIDKFMVAGTEQTSRHFLRKHIGEGRCELIVADSQRGAFLLQYMTGKIDACWIDDGHAEEDLRRDIRCLLPLVKPGGLLIGHDFDVPHNDVARGVLSMIPLAELTFPVPRVWQYHKPA